MKKIAILQSNYIPWKGYFDIIAAVDEFILYDDMQYTRRDWRNRNLIKTAQGPQWLTVPVSVKGKFFQSIRETKISNHSWQSKHWNSFTHHYKKTPYFDEIVSWLEPLYSDHRYTYISELNHIFIESICKYLSITTIISNSWDYNLAEGKTERLIDLCLQANGTEYISGPAAKDYIDESVFQQSGINLTWFDYTGYQEYPQLYPPFTHYVSILDLLFNCGKESVHYMKYGISLHSPNSPS